MSSFFGGLALIGLLAPELLLAQGSACDRTAAAPVDSFTLTIVLAVPPEIEADSKVVPGYLLLAQAINQNLARPMSVVLPNWPGTRVALKPGPDMVPELSAGEFGIDGELSFKLDALGRLVPASLHAETGSIGLDRQLLAGLQVADTNGELALAPAGLRKTRSPLVFHVVATADSVPRSVPIARWRIAALRADSPPVVIAPRVAPVYPPVAEASGIEGEVRLMFIIDTTGHVDPATIRLIKADYREFNDAAVTAIQKSTFRPASVLGCAIPVMVSTRVRFVSR